MIIEWIEIALGLWVLTSPWLLGFSSIAIAKWSSVVVGLALVIINAWSVFEEEKHTANISNTKN